MLAQMNVLRLSGLVLASVNGFFALIVLWTFRDDPAGGSPCFTRDAALASSESDHNQGQIVASYTTFATWVLANVATMLGKHVQSFLAIICAMTSLATT
eukprot:COSAG02_NODE_4290_length_5544_cov_4.972452_5_plen_99_part_00